MDSQRKVSFQEPNAADMKPQNSPEKSRLNEIRTERLSRALQSMRKKSMSACAMFDKCPNMESLFSSEPTKKKSVLQRESSEETEETSSTFTRHRRASVPEAREIRDHSPESFQRNDATKDSALSKGVNRISREFLERQRKLKISEPRPTLVMAEPESPEKHKFAVPARVRSNVSMQAASIFGKRSNSGHYPSSCSKSVSTSRSSGTHSPIRFSTMLSISEPASPVLQEHTFTVLVIGSEGVGKGKLIESFMKSEKRSQGGVEKGEGANVLTIASDQEEISFRFIEVNNEKNDLWLSLAANAYVVLHKSNDGPSFRNATEVVRKLCEGHKSKRTVPVVIISNTTVSTDKSFDQRKQNNDAGRSLAKQHNCKFFEICVSSEANRSTDEILISIAKHLRHSLARRDQGSPRKSNVRLSETDTSRDHHNFSNWLHIRTFSVGPSYSAPKSPKTPTGHKFWNKLKPTKEIEPDEASTQSCVSQKSLDCQKRDIFNRRGSHSLENLETVDVQKKN